MQDLSQVIGADVKGTVSSKNRSIVYLEYSLAIEFLDIHAKEKAHVQIKTYTQMFLNDGKILESTQISFCG